MKFFVLPFFGGLLLIGCAHVSPSASSSPPLAYAQDTFAFANETVWDYSDGRKSTGSTTQSKSYTRHCFVMSRAVVQFRKFARFEPSAPPLPKPVLGQRIRQLAAIDVWKPEWPRSQRVVFPGYQNLRDFSAREPRLLQENLGAAWPVYFRFGNTPMVFPVSRAHQERTLGEMNLWIDRQQPYLVWLYNFPKINMNHVVVAYARVTGSREAFWVADPNYTDRPRKLRYDRATRTFFYEKTFYFPGGPVQARPVYLSPLQ
jgi:hypothetical protein